jgi:hypothetical protein
MAHATGKYSYALCDYCGQRYPYQTLKKNWKGFMVCPEDYEPKEPQLTPLKYRGDAIALQDPRPDRAEPLRCIMLTTLAEIHPLRQCRDQCSLPLLQLQLKA